MPTKRTRTHLDRHAGSLADELAAEGRDGLATTEQGADFTHEAVVTWERRRREGGGPKFIRISSRCVRYRWVDIFDWLRSREATSTAEGRQAELDQAKQVVSTKAKQAEPAPKRRAIVERGDDR